MTRAWLFLSPPTAPRSEIGEVDLGALVLTRVDPRHESIAALVDPRWAIADAFVLQPRGEPERWQWRVAEELLDELADGLGSGPAREIDLASLPTPPTPAPPRAPEPHAPLDLDALEGFIARVCDESGALRDAGVEAQLREAYEQDDDLEDETEHANGFRLARARAKSEDLEALRARVRAVCDVELPADYAAFLTRVGAVRWERIHDDGRTAVPDVVIPVRAAAAMLDDDRFAALRDVGDDYIPFVRVGSERFFALDAGSEPMAVVFVHPDGARPTHASFADWVRAWQAEGMVPRGRVEAGTPARPPARFATADAVKRAWRKQEAWVRKTYEDFRG